MKLRYLVIVALSCGAMSSNGQARAVTITANQIPGIVKASGVLPKGYDGCSAQVTGDEVQISLPLHPGDTADDIKINAVMIGKAIMEKDPSVDMVRVYFVVSKIDRTTGARSDTYNFVEVSSNDIKSFATGLANKENLLKSLVVHERTTGGTMVDVMKMAVGVGPCQSRRLALQAEFTRLCGLDRSNGVEVLPSVDRFAGEMRIINDLAHAGKPAAQIDARITALDKQLKAEIAKFQQLQKQNPNTANKQVYDYLKGHGLSTAGVVVAAAPVQTTAVNTVRYPSAAEFKVLMQKYPQFVPDANGDLYRRRQMLAWRLMSLCESGKGTADQATQFRDIETAAKSGDTVALQTRIKTLERSIGWVYVPGPDGK